MLFAQQPHLDNTRSCESRPLQGPFGSWQCVVRTWLERTCRIIYSMSGIVASWNWFIIAVHRPVTISYLPRNKRPPLPTTWLSRANNYAKLPVLGRIARILSILSTPFLTFTDAFLRYGATATHHRERERLDSTSARALVVRIVHSTRFPSLSAWWRVS